MRKNSKNKKNKPSTAGIMMAIKMLIRRRRRKIRMMMIKVEDYCNQSLRIYRDGFEEEDQYQQTEG
jgi:nicotinamide mononucleotide adenylyltransferase